MSKGTRWPGRVGVCSWSLRPRSARELGERVAGLGLECVQLALDPIREHREGWGEVETMQALRGAGLTIASGMMAMRGEDYHTLDTIRLTGGVRMDSTWEDNVAAARANSRLARRLGIPLVTFHAGFIPHEDGDERWTMLERLRVMADVFDDAGVSVAFETGQERADTLLAALDELDRMGGAQIGVNFDPANMILYGMGDPVKAVKLLAPRIAQVHVKNALPTKKAGTWGTEVCAGTGGKGSVPWAEFFAELRRGGVGGNLIIEREAGERRDGDIAAARAIIERHAMGLPAHEASEAGAKRSDSRGTGAKRARSTKAGKSARAGGRR